MIARAFIPKGFFDQHEEGRLFSRKDLSRRSDVDKQPASGCKQLFSYQYGKGGTNGVADNPQFKSIELEVIHIRVVTGPIRVQLSLIAIQQVLDDISIRI